MARKQVETLVKAYSKGYTEGRNNEVLAHGEHNICMDLETARELYTVLAQTFIPYEHERVHQLVRRISNV